MGKTLAVVINGAGGTGKDTFVEMVREHLQGENLTSSNHSSVDQVKRAARILGWDEVKDERGRQFLSDLKDLSTQVFDGPMKFMSGLIAERNLDVMFFHIREPQEIAKFLEAHEGSISVLVSRDGVNVFGNHADKNVENHPYTTYVDNNGSLEDLDQYAAQFARVLAEDHRRLNHAPR